MQSLRIAEVPPAVLGGRLDNADIGHAQNTNVVPYNDRHVVLTKVIKRLPETFYPSKVHRYNADKDGLQDNGTLRTKFNGRNLVAQGSNPVIDFSTGSWAAPLDSFIRASEVATTAAGAFTIGQKYEIKTVGTTDYTLIGASSNTVGVVFTATGAGSGNGTASESIRWVDDDTIVAGNFITGQQYCIAVAGTTDFTLIGAADSNPGTVFTATGEGTGTGTAYDGVYTADELESGLFYIVKDPGTTDCTAVGASASVADVIFQATGAGSGTGTFFRTKGARHGDMASCAVSDAGTDYQQLYINPYDYKDGGGNQLVLLESTDGFATHSVIGEIQFGGGNFGSTVADVVAVGSTLYMVCGEDAGVSRGYQKRLRYSEDRGRTWSEVGTIIELSSSAESAQYYGMPVGRFLPYDGGDYVYISVPCSRISGDWPEANLIYRRAVADLKSAGSWEEWQGGASLIRGPQHGGVWNVDYFDVQDGFYWGLTNEFGAIDHDDVNTDDMNTLRGTPYYKQDDFSFKHTGIVKTQNTLALTDWTYWPFEDGDTVELIHLGKYLASGLVYGANTYLTSDATDPGRRWVVEKQAEFWMFKQAAATTVSLSTGGAGTYANRRAIGLPIEVRTHDATTAANNIEHHWQVVLHGNDSPTTCSLINRTSSLALFKDCAQRPAIADDFRHMWRINKIDT